MDNKNVPPPIAEPTPVVVTKKKHRKWPLVVGFVILVGIGGMFWMRSGPSIDLNNLPQFIQADFIDLSKIVSISKFRSGSGHDFSYRGKGDETCRSLKHYFNVQETQASIDYKSAHDGRPQPFSLTNAIPIYSPVDGTITKIETEQMPIGEQLYIRPDSYPQVFIRLFHIYKLDSIEKGTKVKAGQQIGNIGADQNTDIAIMVTNPPRYTFVSYFDVMPDSVFAAYQARGVTSRDELIISQEYRDSHPLTCNGEQFTQPETDADFVRLSGYVSLGGPQGGSQDGQLAKPSTTAIPAGNEAGSGAGSGIGTGGGNGQGGGNRSGEGTTNSY